MKINTNTRYGPMMYMENDIYIGGSLDAYGESCQDEANLLTSFLSKGDVAVDVGANIGTLTIPMAKAVGPEGYVLAFEPQPHIYYGLCGNIALNNQYHVQAFQKAVSDNRNPLYIPVLNYDAKNNFGGIRLATDSAATEQAWEHKIAVNTLLLDDCRLSSLRVLKIDVEGMEIDVLYGATETIRRCKPLIYVECLENREELLDFAKKLNYKVALHKPPLYNENNFYNHPIDIHKEGNATIACFNFIFYTDEKVEGEHIYFDPDNSEHY